MIRYFIVLGDKTTADGSVVATQSTATSLGKAIAMLGDTVYCRDCETTGHIIGHGPRRKIRVMGREPALDGDLCACKCDPRPKLINSSTHMRQIMTAEEVIAQGYGSWVGEADDRQNAENVDADDLEQYFEFIDDSGAIVDLVYRLDGAEGKLYEGKFDLHGKTISVPFKRKITITSWTQNL